MSLHPALLAELLADEVEATRGRPRLVGRFESIVVEGPDVYVRLLPTRVGAATIRFGGAGYDAEPFQVAVVDEAGNVAPQAEWPPGLFHSIHPVLQRGFVCIQGTFEYHCHPQHLGNPWATHREMLRLPQLLRHILKKVGQ